MNTCLQCHKPLPTDNPKAKFCSPKCKTYHARGIKHKPNLMAKEPKSAVKMKLAGTDNGDSGDEVQLTKPVTGNPTTRTKPSTPPHLSPEVLAAVPRIFPSGLSKSDLHKFLHGGWEFMGSKSGGIAGYNRTMLEIGMPWRCTTLMELEQWLAKSGYDVKLARGVGYEPQEAAETEDEDVPQ